MSNNEEYDIRPYTVKRTCVPHPDIQQLVLKEVDTTESVYTRTLGQLKDVALPDGLDIREALRVNGHTEYVSWDLCLMLKQRQDWRPSGYGLGELLFTLSLLPNEELTLEIKTWETSKTQQDEEIIMEERYVSDIKTSSSDTHEVKNSLETKTREYADAKAGFSKWGFSASVKGGWSKDVTENSQNLAKQVRENVQQATNEHKATHKVKMAISRESGSESKTTRKIKNINQTRTLNVNYYEVLREYEVSLVLYDITLVLLGAEPDLMETGLGVSRRTYRHLEEDATADISLGQMIQLCRSAAWVQVFTDRYGVSPIKLLREMWSRPLYDAAPLTEHVSDAVSIPPEDREAFQSTMLQYVQPSPGWVEPDEAGALRWGYELIPGQEEAALTYLSQFFPYSVGQTLIRAVRSGMDYSTACSAIAARYATISVPSIRAARRRHKSRSVEQVSPADLGDLKIAEDLKHNVYRPGFITSVQEFFEGIPAVVEGILGQFAEAKEDVPRELDSWKVTLPTQGVYADLALGVCSGAEDYFEAQRQFDLELKQLEVEKLRWEVRRLELLTQRVEAGTERPNVLIENPPDGTSLEVKVETKGEASIGFEETE